MSERKETEIDSLAETEDCVTQPNPFDDIPGTTLFGKPKR